MATFKKLPTTKLTPVKLQEQLPSINVPLPELNLQTNADDKPAIAISASALNKGALNDANIKPPSKPKEELVISKAIEIVPTKALDNAIHQPNIKRPEEYKMENELPEYINTDDFDEQPISNEGPLEINIIEYK